MSANPETGVFPDGDLDPDVADDELEEDDREDGYIWTEEDQQNLYDQNEDRERLR